MRVNVIISVIILLTLVNCEKAEKIYLLPERAEIVDVLTEAVLSDESMSIEGLNDGSARDRDYNSSALQKVALSDTFANDFSKIKFGRVISQVRDTTVIIDLGWDSALVELRYHFTGNFKTVSYLSIRDSSIGSIHYNTVSYRDTTDINVDSTWIDTSQIWDYDTTYTVITLTDTVSSDTTWSYSSHSSAHDSTSKAFSLTSRQKAIFLRTQNTDNARKDWHLKYVSPMLIANSSLSPVIEQVSLTISGQPTTVKVPLTAGADPLNVYFNRDTLDQINYNTSLTASMTITNTAPFEYSPGELVLLHFGQAINRYKIRTALSDTDNNGVHTGSFSVISHGSKIYRLFIDLIDYRTIFTTDGAYNSEIIMIPFRVP